MAATTPPSGSQPPATGEWSDLAARFPQLEISELLGRGGMGTVYKARQRTLDRIIALKVIPPDAAADPAFAERFAREARAMARLNHPNIVTVYDFGHDGNLYWLMMEYVDGVNLRHTLRASHLQPREALAIVPQVCDALQYAHDQGVVHRDIKPENVLLDRSGRVKIADFGLAKLLGKGPDDFTLTRTQQVMGTPRYMAPEQIERPTAVDHRADIYSLGVVLYEMLTGELPLGRFDPPSHKVQLDVRIDQVVLRALEKAPERRYQRASEIKTDLASSVNWAVPAVTPAAGATPETRSVPTPPTWHTPTPASKDAPTGYPSFAGGVPLTQVLMVAFGIVMGVLMMTGGLAAIIYGFVYSFGAAVESAIVFSWWGAGFGCLVGGFGSAAGSYNTYRQMAGAEDLLRSKRVTWFDWTMHGYLTFGLALLVIGGLCTMEGATRGFSLPMLLIGGIATFQAALFVLWRTSVRLSGSPVESTRAVPKIDPVRERLRAKVTGPAIGLIVAGILGLTPFCVVLLAIPAWTLHPMQGQPYREPFESVDQYVLPPPSFLPLVATQSPAAAIALQSASFLPPLILAQTSEPQRAFTMFWLPVAVIVSILTLAQSATLIIGGWQMRKLRSYGLAFVASVLAVLPCTFAWVIGLPMGIWALMVLMDPEVKAGFEA